MVVVVLFVVVVVLSHWVGGEVGAEVKVLVFLMSFH